MKAKDSAHILIIHNDKILLFLRDNIDIPSPNSWTLIGGGIEKNETPLECIKRESKEEANHTPQNIKYLGVKIKPDKSEWHIFYALVDANETKLFKKGVEGQGVQFFTIKEAKSVNLSPNLRLNIHLVEKVHKELLTKGKLNLDEINLDFSYKRTG